MILLTYIFILLIFALLSYTLYKIAMLYFNFKSKGQESKHYPLTLAITLLSIPLISKAFSIPSYIIKVFNKYTSLDLPMPTDDWKSMVFYALYIFAVIALSYIYYKLPPIDEERFRDEGASQKINYPDETKVVVSPHLHKRIQELFELRYEKLKLSYDEKEQVLVGQYSDAIHSYRYFIYCDSKVKEVSKTKQDEVFERLKELSHDFLAEDKEFYEHKYLFFIEDGTFEKNDNKHLKRYTEDVFLNVIIDFSSYLQKNIDRFDTQATDIGGVSLKESFIEPRFNKGESNLKAYFDEWLSEKSLRHISLLADYGMGKTSFLKYYSKYLSQKILDGEAFTRYPIFISLTNTSPMSNDGIETKIKGFVSEELGVNYALFERLVHLGKIVFILDGFDEMGFIGTAKTRFEQFNSIWQLATKNNKILISGRPSYLPTDFERKNVLNIVDNSVTDVHLTPFTEVIELDYFELERIEETLNIYYDGDDVKQYLTYIKQNRSILDLCKRPSMLHMTMSILPNLYSENFTKVITSSDIMNKYTEYWISRQESKEITGYFSKNDNRKKEFIINFFTELSGEMFKDKTLVISKKVLDELIDKAFQKSKMDIESNETMLEGFKNELYSGYFIEVDINYSKEDHFKFVHKSIFEFFVSKKIIKLIEEKKFSDKLMSIDWNSEVMDFIDDSINHEKYENSKYPSLIMLRDSWLDKWVLIPIISSISLNTKLYFILFIPILLVFNMKLDRRFKFIYNAYFLNKKDIVSCRQQQHFLDFSSLHKVYHSKNLNIVTFKFLYIRDLVFLFSNLNKVSFDYSTLKKISFQYSNLSKVNFHFSKIKRIEFITCNLNSIQIDESIFIQGKRKPISELIIVIISKGFLKILYNLIFIKSEIIFKNMTIKNFDQQSLESFQNFIKNNNIKGRDVICTSSELKDKLFAKLEGRE